MELVNSAPLVQSVELYFFAMELKKAVRFE